jgi:hypothetical protein
MKTLELPPLPEKRSVCGGDKNGGAQEKTNSLPPHE